MNLKRSLIILVLFIFNFSNAISIEPDVFVQSTVNRASQILSENISKDEKINKLKLIAKETVDIRGVGFYSLGSARKNLNNSQKETYSKLFEAYFLKKPDTSNMYKDTMMMIVEDVETKSPAKFMVLTLDEYFRGQGNKFKEFTRIVEDAVFKKIKSTYIVYVNT